MPLYEFMCKNCLKITIVYMPNITSNKKSTKCNFCGEDAEKVISVPSGFNIKGYSAKNGYSKGEK